MVSEIEHLNPPIYNLFKTRDPLYLILFQARPDITNGRWKQSALERSYDDYDFIYKRTNLVNTIL